MTEVKKIEETGAALAVALEGLTGPLGERAKTLAADATRAAVQAYWVEQQTAAKASAEEPVKEPKVEPKTVKVEPKTGAKAPGKAAWE